MCDKTLLAATSPPPAAIPNATPSYPRTAEPEKRRHRYKIECLREYHQARIVSPLRGRKKNSSGQDESNPTITSPAALSRRLVTLRGPERHTISQAGRCHPSRRPSAMEGRQKGTAYAWMCHLASDQKGRQPSFHWLTVAAVIEAATKPLYRPYFPNSPPPTLLP